MVIVCLGRILEGSHASFVEVVPFKTIAAFTGLQLAYFLICYGVTWIPIFGILFPVPFFLLIVIRERLLPKMFKRNHLQELDASGYEEIAGTPHSYLMVRMIFMLLIIMTHHVFCKILLYSKLFSLGTENLFYQDKKPDTHSEGSSEDFYDAEILDEMTTNRGELKVITISNLHERNQSSSEDRHV